MARVKGGRKSWKKLNLKNAFAGLATIEEDDSTDNDNDDGNMYSKLTDEEVDAKQGAWTVRACPCGTWRPRAQEKCECGGSMFYRERD
eukprot:5265621-Karenia_brevis.AAC.1